MYGRETNRVLVLTHHEKSCRCVLFDYSGQGMCQSHSKPGFMVPLALYTASSDLSIKALDTTGTVVWNEEDAHEYLAYFLLLFDGRFTLFVLV